MSQPHTPGQPGATPPPPPPRGGAGGSGGASGNRQLMLVLAYLGPLALIPYLTETGDKEVQWHAKHGLVLFGAELALWMVLFVSSYIIPCLGCLVLGLLVIPLLVLHVVCIMKALNGERLLIPGLSELVEKF